MPDLSLERSLWNSGYKYIAGIDEVGRGSFAGPLFASCVVFAPHTMDASEASVLINDSKKLTEKKRKSAFDWIDKHALGWAIGRVKVEEINNIGISKSTSLAFERSVLNLYEILKIYPEYLLLDAFEISNLNNVATESKQTIRQKAITKGDAKSISIAAASIMAKVKRDEYMCELSKEEGCDHYEWHRNKGYGTAIHRQALLQIGPNKHHRKQFISKYVKKDV